MADYKIVNKTLSIEILGVVYNIKKPKFKEIIELEEKISSLSAKEKIMFVHEKLISYGIPNEVLNELDGDSYIELMEIVNGTKKNSQ